MQTAEREWLLKCGITKKNDLLELVQTMRELCGEILLAWERNDTDYLLELLEQGQQAAICMGETIEKSEGEGTEPVSALEAFCEHMYLLGEAAETGGVALPKQRKILDKLLLNIGNGIRHLPMKYEIVFFHTKLPCGTVWRVFILQPQRIRIAMYL